MRVQARNRKVRAVAEDGYSGERVRAPLIAHVIYRLAVGGLENGLINLINHFPAGRFRHAIVCLTDYSSFRERIQVADVPVFALHKPPGNSPVMHFKLWRLFRQLRPDIVHTRNLAAVEAALPAALAGVPACVHGEHGREVGDLDGDNRKYQFWRRFFKPFVDHYVTVSQDLKGYLVQKILVEPQRVTQIYNGVDSARFRPATARREELPCPGFAEQGLFVIGSVGRMQQVKDQLTLVRAFTLLMQEIPDAARLLRLVIIGDGPLREQARALLEQAGIARFAWLPGERDDVPTIMRGLDLFVLPSIAEGISNTILEAMATGLPVVATSVGGNVELVKEGETGRLVPPADPARMARAIREYLFNSEDRKRHGARARRLVESDFSMNAMVNAYAAVYASQLTR